MRKTFISLALSALLATTTFATQADLTYYWICFESDESGSGPKDTVLKTCGGKNIATVTNHYAKRIRVEGTGKLNDGRVLNIGGCDCGNSFSCFEEIDQHKYPYGIGPQDNPIFPYSSVAENDFPIGTTLYVQKLDGLTLPGTGGQKHNGCVSVDDRGYGFGSNHIDFFVAKEKYYENIDNILKITKADYQRKNCQVLHYNFGATHHNAEEQVVEEFLN
ncbi:3d domain protein [Stylonychia lemnae]|uniref:3d domain protein n=1 Tax=Stylonychia lemnae TaxID=5949 RepID=A0A077ZT22_STYLE|nr:3d domain protein [Stylonychia lemnae]|eukprot:CDW73033.1 3d domain protein [Stylonychia lemnae]